MIAVADRRYADAVRELRAADAGICLICVLPRKRLGELYESKGERQKAASHYTKFVELWQNADPDLQPKVTDVRARLRRLGDIEARK